MLNNLRFIPKPVLLKSNKIGRTVFVFTPGATIFFSHSYPMNKFF